MGRRNQLDSSFKAIEEYFDNLEFKSFTENRFKDILDKNRYSWNIPRNKYAKQVLSYLVIKKVLFSNEFPNVSIEPKIVYSWKTKDEFTVISGLKNGSYFTHYSAIYLHQLSLQIPKTIYLNFEHGRSKNIIENDDEECLTQQSIDNAFKGNQRKSSLSFLYLDRTIIIINGKYTNRLGVIKRQNINESFEFTDLERTLIDISVRPVYAGGVFEVLEAYKYAKEKLDVAKMADYLNKMNFIYPYHQVIGFYLDKAGYDSESINYFKKEMKFNFYLTYDIRNKDFSQNWKLYYPKGF